MHVVVIGGGIVRASVAYHLSGANGVSVTVCERNEEELSETTRWSIASFKFVSDGPHRRMRRETLDTYNTFMNDPRASPWHDLLGQSSSWRRPRPAQRRSARPKPTAATRFFRRHLSVGNPIVIE